MNVGLLIVRLIVGLTLAAHGGQKLFGWFGGHGIAGTGGFMEQLGFRPGRVHAALAGLTELAGGLLLAAGFLTPLASAVALAVMIVAAVTVHLQGGFFLQNGGFEYTFVLGGTALALAFAGPGDLSLDYAFGIPWQGDSWGLTALVVGVAGAGLQLLTRRRAVGTPAKA